MKHTAKADDQSNFKVFQIHFEKYILFAKNLE